MPGRPEIFATTKSFLDDLNLRSLEELPPLTDLGNLVEQAPNAEMDLAAALSGESPTMAEGVMDADEEGDAAPENQADAVNDESADEAEAEEMEERPVRVQLH